MPATARLFLCARCRAQVLICSGCDRGHSYCADGCSVVSRRTSVREAGRRYQRSRPGRFAHAARMRRYRARQQQVTQHGSAQALRGALLAINPMTQTSTAVKPIALEPSAPRCHLCACVCSVFVRRGWLRHPGSFRLHHRTGPQRDH